MHKYANIINKVTKSWVLFLFLFCFVLFCCCCCCLFIFFVLVFFCFVFCFVLFLFYFVLFVLFCFLCLFCFCICFCLLVLCLFVCLFVLQKGFIPFYNYFQLSIRRKDWKMTYSKLWFDTGPTYTVLRRLFRYSIIVKLRKNTTYITQL